MTDGLGPGRHGLSVCTETHAVETGARARRITWSMKRFRHKSGETDGRLIDEMRTFVETHGAMAAMAIATSTIPVRLRPTAYALSSD